MPCSLARMLSMSTQTSNTAILSPAIFDSQVPELTGEWVEHPDASYSGLYDPLEHCPGFAMDFTCARPYEPAAANPELHAREFRQVPASPVLASRGPSLALCTTTS